MAQSSPSPKAGPSSSGLSRPVLAIIPVIVAALLYFSNARSAFGSNDHSQVIIKQGTIVGKLLDDGKYPAPIEGFMGIPYALPPVNDRRFRPAVPVPEGNGTLNAFYMGPRYAV